jgi:HK97 family phage prohead protease
MSAIETVTRFLAVDDMEIVRTDRAGRTVTAYAAVFDQEAEIQDRHGHYWEKISRAAYNRTLAHGIERVQVYYNHGYDLTGRPNGLLAVPCATPVSIAPDGKGLLTVSRYNDGELADSILAAWEGGQIRGQSFTGRVYQSRTIGKNGKLPIVERTELGLKEYGPTPSPAYVGAGLVAIRSQEDLQALVRSMIADMTGTPQDSPARNGTPAPGPAAPEDSSEIVERGHSGRNRLKARQRANALRAMELGVTDGQAP